MSRSLRWLVAPLCLLALVARAHAEEQIHWAPNLQTAIETASRQNQLVLIHFWTPNCPPCRMLERNVFSRADVADAIHRDYVAVKVNAEAMPEIAEQYGVDRWPTDIIVTPAGYQLHTMVSPQDPSEYIGSIGRVAAQRRPGAQLAANSAPRAQAPQGEFGQQPQIGYGQQPQGSPAQDQQQSRFSQFASQHQQPEDYGEAQPAAVGRDYANPYSQPPAQQNPTVASRPPYEGEPRGEAQSAPNNGRPQQTSNPYVNQAPPADAARPAGPQKGLDGYCPVTLVEQTKWVRGDPRFGIVHRGHVYLFTTEAEKQRFWQDPDRYAPILSGNDPVVFAEGGQLAPGSRRHGVFYRNQIFMFSSEENLQRFWSSPQRYADVAYQAMRRTAEGQRR